MQTTTAIALPSNINNAQAVAILNRKGTAVGTRITFGGTHSARELKALVKAGDPKMSARDVTKRVNEMLTGRRAVAWAETHALLSACQSAGFVSNTADVREKSAVIRLVKPVEPKPAKEKSVKADADALKAAQDETAALKKEIEALKALIAK